MTLRKTLVASALMLVLGASAAVAQQQTGEIYGRAADNTGAVLPGATVTVAGPALIQPRVAVTSETGTYRVPELPIGTYSVTFELAGFRTMALQDIRVTIGFRAQVNGEHGALDGAGNRHRDRRQPAGRHARDRHELDASTSRRCRTSRRRATRGSCSSARPASSWTAPTSAATSRASSRATSRAARSTGNNKWSIDGVDITDMAATGASPMYYDFDMLEEMQVTTGGADVTQQTGGVGINLVTKSGTDRFKGNGRFLVTDEELQGDNITPELQAQGAGSGAPIQNIKDYGFDVGGPIAKGKVWYWGSYGTQDIKVGVVGFYKNTPECRPNGQPLNSRTADTDLLRSCLETDLTTLNNYNWKITWVPFQNNRFNFQNTWAEKVRNARDASDLRPIETTYRQKAVASDVRHLRLADRPDAVLEGRRSARDQRPHARRRDVVAPRQQLRARLPRRRAAPTCRRASKRRPASGAVRTRPSIVPPSDQQPRRGQHLLPAGDARAATTRSSSATAGATRTRPASTIAAASSMRASPTAWPTRPTSGATSTPSRTSTRTRSTCRTRSRATA